MKVNIGRYPKGDKQRKINVQIDKWDTWSADHTLALIIAPLLVKIKEDKQGSPPVDDADVPEHLRSTAAPSKENDWDIDDNWHLRWDYVLDEMIWAFEQDNNDWEQQYYSGEVDFQFEKIEGQKFSRMVDGPNHTFKIDQEGIKKHHERIKNGRRLFAKYYDALWD